MANTISELIQKAYQHWDNAEIVGTIGIEMESRSRLPLARTFLGRALSLDPLTRPEWYANYAFAHFRDIGNLSADGERILVDGIEETDSDFLKATYLMVQEAEEVAQKIIEDIQDSTDVSVQFAFGYALMWRGEQERAWNVLSKAITQVDDGATPLGLDLYCSAMNWMRGQGGRINMHTECLPYLARLIVHAPNVYNYRGLKVQMFQVLQDYVSVRDTAIDTLAIFPDEETTMCALATAYKKLGDDDHAIQWYNRAIGAKPSYVRARILLGKLYEEHKQMEHAESVFREIASAFPEYQMGKIEIAYFLQRAGKHDEAASLFRFGYDRIKPFERATVENHPEGKILFEAMKHRR
jgi:tetratricopeptide (TPR) repeat protein